MQAPGAAHLHFREQDGQAQPQSLRASGPDRGRVWHENGPSALAYRRWGTIQGARTVLQEASCRLLFLGSPQHLYLPPASWHQLGDEAYATYVRLCVLFVDARSINQSIGPLRGVRIATEGSRNFEAPSE